MEEPLLFVNLFHILRLSTKASGAFERSDEPVCECNSHTGSSGCLLHIRTAQDIIHGYAVKIG